MSTKVRIEFQSEGFAALINSAEVQADIQSRAARTAAAAGDGFEVEEVQLNFGGSPRPGAFVVATTREARQAEAEDKVLTSAIDAGR